MTAMNAMAVSPNNTYYESAHFEMPLPPVQPEWSIRANPDNYAYLARQPDRVLKWYIASDIGAFMLSFLVALSLSIFINNVIFGRAVLEHTQGSSMVRFTQPVMLMMGVLLWFQHTGHYRMRMPFWLEGKRVVSALCFAMLVDGFLMFAEKQDSSRLWLMSSWIIAVFAIMASRYLVRAYLYKKGVFHVRTLLIGAGETAQHVREALKSEPEFGYEIVSQVQNLPMAFLQAQDSWKNLCAQHNADHIVIALDGYELADSEYPLGQLAKEPVSFWVSPPVHKLPVSGMVPHYFLNHDALLMSCSNELEQPFNCFLKRMIDIVVSGSALIALSPIMLVIALLVRRDGGPALYGHLRLGKDGRIFSCLKFRSMVLNGDAVLKRHLAENPAALQEWQAVRKLRNDPRVTKLGKFLRRSSLDELPQLINVLRGDMSLVGPRPIVNAEIEHYEGDIAHYYRVRPGITGLWQVSGRNDVSYTQRVHMDSWYVKNWSLWHDIAILCKTVPALLKRSGAY